MSDNFISVKFKFYERKFEVLIESWQTVYTLKSIIKETLMKRINLKKYGFDIHNLKERNILINKASPPLIMNEEFDQKSLLDVGITDNEELTITLRILDEATNRQLLDNKKEFNDFEKEFSKFSVYRKAIPGDNSCLFNAINYAINQCLTESHMLRELVCVEIQQNPVLYNSAVLETNPIEYCEWILQDDSWGGGIEMAILSKYFLIRIDIVDILNNTIEIIGDVS